MTVQNFTYTFEIKKKFNFIKKFLLLLALIALFFKAYAVEADIRLLAFYLHLPDQKGFALFGMNSQRPKTRPGEIEVVDYFRLEWMTCFIFYTCIPIFRFFYILKILY